MASIASRAVRRLAFQAIFQLDAQGADAASAADRLTLWIEGEEAVGAATPAQRREAVDLACAAYAARARADAAILALAPEWPTHRQPPVDRAILRLCHHELTAMHEAGGTDKGAMIINDAVDLAREFSTPTSPAFVNALLDKAVKARVAAAAPVASPAESTPVTPPAP